MQIVTIGGVEFRVIKGLGDQPFMIPHDPVTQKSDFPFDGQLLKSSYTASRGISAHTFDLTAGSEDEKMGLPSIYGENGFSAKHLNLLGDDSFYPECWQVLMANGWAENFSRLSDHIIEEVNRLDGSDITEKAKTVFGDNWDSYIAERASVHLAEPFTRVWYAANLISAYYARQDDILFGYLWSEYRMKMRVESNADTGSKVIAGTKSAAERTNSMHTKLRTARFEIMEQLVPLIGTDKAAITCEVQGLGSAQAVKRQWNRFQSKKGDT